MHLKQLKITNFRNFSKEKIILSPKLNIFYGSNGVGKTNILEAIYVATNLKSNRTSNDQSLIKIGETNFQIDSILQDQKSKKLLKYIYNGQKRYSVDNEIVNTNYEYIDNIKVICFFPSDIEKMKSFPEERRSLIDNSINNINIEFHKLLKKYEKTHRMRVNYLKNERIDEKYFKALSDYYIKISAQIIYFRKKYIDLINERISEKYYHLSKLDNVYIEYEKKLDGKNIEEIENKLHKDFEKNKFKEIKMRKNFIGANREDVIFYQKETNIKTHFSQGQLRLLILAYKFVEADIFYEKTSTYPILLLDDVLSEMDGSNRRRFIKNIEKYKQVILTTTHINKYKYQEAKLFKLEKGKIILEKEVKNERK